MNNDGYCLSTAVLLKDGTENLRSSSADNVKGSIPRSRLLHTPIWQQ